MDNLKEILAVISRGFLFLHDNAPAHWTLATQKRVAYLGFKYLDDPPYSPNHTPSDYHLFPGVKKLKEHHFSTDAEAIAEAETWLDGQNFECFLSALRKLKQRAKKYIELRGMLNKSRV